MANMTPHDRQMMKPKAEFAISLDRTDKKGKVIINLCSGELVRDAVLGDVGKPKAGATGKFSSSGLDWQIPYIIGHKRLNLDSDNICWVYDVAFSENSLQTANTDRKFRLLLVQTAVEAVSELLGDDGVERLEDYAELAPIGDPPLMNINLDSIEKNDPKNRSLPTFAPKHRILPNPLGVKCPDYYVRMEGSNRNIRQVVVCATMSEYGLEFKDVDVQVQPEIQEILITYKDELRLQLRLACPFLKQFKVKWRKQRKHLKVSLSVPEDFDGKDQRFVSGYKSKLGSKLTSVASDTISLNE